MITPIMLACNPRYAKSARISIETFFEYHTEPLYVVVDDGAQKALSNLEYPYLHLVPLGDYRKIAEDKVGGIHEFYIMKYDQDGDHDRAYSSMKPVIMDLVINDVAPKTQYIWSLDADTMFSGDIIKPLKREIIKRNHKPDIYMVRRTDKRMLTGRSCTPGSGFTLWKKSCQFVPLFQKRYNSTQAGIKGGSQILTHQVKAKLFSILLTNCYYHFISPDLQNSKLTDVQIATFKPAYIHLHGKDSYRRLLRFQRILGKGK